MHKTPKDFFIGFFSQLLILPIIALGIALILDLSAPIAVGLMIIAAAPGGVTSNVLTKFADGDVALSISLTAIVSLISIISVPFVVINSAEFLGVVVSKDISMTGIALKMALVVTVQVIIGMIIRGFAENFIVSKINIHILSDGDSALAFQLKDISLPLKLTEEHIEILLKTDIKNDKPPYGMYL